MLLLALHGTLGAHHLTVGNGEGEEALLLLRVVHAEGGAYHEILERSDAQVNVAKRAPLRVFVLLGIVNHAQRVLALGIGAEGLGILAVLGVDGEIGVELQGVLQHSAGSIDALRAVDGEILADDHLAVEQLVVGIGTAGETVEIGVLDGALVVVVANAEERAAPLRAVADGEVVLLHDARARYLVEPVGVAGTHGGVVVEIHVHRHLVEHGDALGVVAPVVVVAQVVVRGVQAVVHRCLPEGAAPLAGVHRLNLVRIERGGYASVEIHLDFAVLALLGGDDDDTVGGTRTIDRGRGGILEHLDALDVIAVQLVHTGLRGHSVDDVERVVVVQSSHTAYAHRGGTARITVGLDVHARHAALQGLHRVVLVLLGHLVDTHRGDGTCQVGLALGGVACHHHFLQHLVVGQQFHLHAVLGGQLLRLVADVGNHQHGAFLNF